MDACLFRSIIRQNMELNGIKYLKDIVQFTGLSYPSFKARMDNPTLFQIYQIEGLCKGLKIPDEDKMKMLGV